MDIIGVERGRMELLKGELDILHHFLNFQPFVSIEVSVLPQVKVACDSHEQLVIFTEDKLLCENERVPF